MKNIDKRNLIISLAVGLGGGILIIIPALGWVDIYEGGGAMIMLGLLLAITGPIVAMLFWHRAKIHDQLLRAGDGVMRWSIDKNLWVRFIDDEKDFRRESKLGIRLTILAFSVLFGGLFWYFDREAGWIVVLVLLGVNVLIAIVAWWSNLYLEKWRDFDQVECIIGEDGLILAGQLHVWRGWGARLEQVDFSQGKLNILAVTYSTPNRYSRQFYTVRIPVPADNLAEAEKAADKLMRAENNE